MQLRCALFFGVATLSAGCTGPNYLNLNEIERFTHCSISLEQAKTNLMRLGYGILSESATQFTTDYRKSDFESKITTLTLEPILDTQRRMVVFQDGQDHIRFTYSYRKIAFPEKIARLVNPQFTADERENLVMIHQEVCGAVQEEEAGPADVRP